MQIHLRHVKVSRGDPLVVIMGHGPSLAGIVISLVVLVTIVLVTVILIAVTLIAIILIVALITVILVLILVSSILAELIGCTELVIRVLRHQQQSLP